jgi:hypothetical protein
VKDHLNTIALNLYEDLQDLKSFMPVGWVKKKVIVRNIINEMIKA